MVIVLNIYLSLLMSIQTFDTENVEIFHIKQTENELFVILANILDSRNVEEYLIFKSYNENTKTRITGHTNLEIKSY